MKNKILSIISIITFVIGVAALPCQAMAAEDNASSIGKSSGTTGSCTWSLDDNGVLTISGEGSMGSYQQEPAPWGTGIKKLIVEEGVTYLGSDAFENCSDLTSITLPESLNSLLEFLCPFYL